MNEESKTCYWVFISWNFILILVAVIVGYNGLYGQDSYEYLRYCVRLHEYFSNNDFPGQYFWPVNYPLIGSLLSFIAGPQAALQLLSVMGAAWIVYLVCMFLISQFPGREREVVIYVVLFLGLSPYFFRYSISTMSDITALAFACTAWYGLYKYSGRWLMASWFFASLAIFTRFAFIPMLTPLFVFTLLRNRLNWQQKIIQVIVALIPVVIYLYFKQEHKFDIFNHQLITEWSFSNYFRSDFNNLEGANHYLLPNILFVLSFLIHPGFVFPGILFLLILFRRKAKPILQHPVIITGMVMYILFIAGLPSRNFRYLLPVLPFYVAACFPAFLIFLSWFYSKKNSLSAIAIMGFVVQLILLIRAFLPFYNYNREEKFISEKLIELDPKVLYTFGIDGALRCYGYKGTIINLWDEQLDSVASDALLLFNKQQFEDQWRNKNPMLNFSLIVDSARAVKIDEPGFGWEIYEVKETYPPAHPGLSGIR